MTEIQEPLEAEAAIVAQSQIVMRAQETGRALAKIAADMNEFGPPDYRKFFEGSAAAANTWKFLPVPINTPYYALVAKAYHDEVKRLLDQAGV